MEAIAKDFTDKAIGREYVTKYDSNGNPYTTLEVTSGASKRLQEELMDLYLV
jgi:hypothetical protein